MPRFQLDSFMQVFGTIAIIGQSVTYYDSLSLKENHA